MGPPKKYFHGWYIVGACFVITLQADGLMSKVYSKYFFVISEELEWSHRAVGWASLAMWVLTSIVVLLVGWLVDREGSKKLMLVGCLVAGAAMILFSFVWDVWSYVLLSLFVVAGGFAASGIPVVVLLLRWFRQKRGLAIAIVSVGGSIGSGIFWIWNSYLGMESHWRVSVVLIGAVALAVTVPLVRKLVSDRPCEMGIQPDGIESGKELAVQPMGHTLKQACRTRSFWLIAGGLFLTYSVFMPVEIYGIRYLTDSVGHPSGTVAMLYKVGAVLAVPGAILLGSVADRWDARKAYVAGILVVVIGILLFAASSYMFVAALFILVYGISSKSLLVVFPLIVADSHGLHRFGIIYAIMLLIVPIGSSVGFLLPILLSKVAPGIQVYSDPRILFLALIPLALLSAYCIYKVRPLNPNPEA